MSFTLRAVEDDLIALGSSDPGDIGRVFRLLGYDLPVDPGTRITYVCVTIAKETLTAGSARTNLQLERPEPDADTQDELPF